MKDKKEIVARLKENQSSTPSKWIEKAEWRLQNKSWLQHSQRIAVMMMEKMDVIDMNKNS